MILLISLEDFLKLLSKHMLLLLRLLVCEFLYFLSLIILECPDEFLYRRTWFLLSLLLLCSDHASIREFSNPLNFHQNLFLDFNLLSKFCIVLILLAYCSSNSYSLVVILGEFIMFTAVALIFTAWVFWLIETKILKISNILEQ